MATSHTTILQSVKCRSCSLAQEAAVLASAGTEPSTTDICTSSDKDRQQSSQHPADHLGPAPGLTTISLQGCNVLDLEQLIAAPGLLTFSSTLSPAPAALLSPSQARRSTHASAPQQPSQRTSIFARLKRCLLGRSAAPCHSHMPDSNCRGQEKGRANGLKELVSDLPSSAPIAHIQVNNCAALSCVDGAAVTCPSIMLHSWKMLHCL